MSYEAINGEVNVIKDHSGRIHKLAISEDEGKYIHLDNKIIYFKPEAKNINYKDFKTSLQVENYEKKLNIRKIKEFIRGFIRRNDRKPTIAELKEYQKKLPLPHFSSSDLYFFKEGKHMERKEKTINSNPDNIKDSGILTEQEKGEL